MLRVMEHASDSGEQRSAERDIIKAVADDLGVTLRPREVTLSTGERMNIDGSCDVPPVFVEAYAHQGVLRSGQFHKLMSDAFKLATLRLEHPEARLILAVAHRSVANSIQKGW